MVNQFSPFAPRERVSAQERVAASRQKREERNRKAQQQLSQYGGAASSIAMQLANQTQQTLDAPIEPQIPVMQQQSFDQSQAATQQVQLPFGQEATVGAAAGAKENSGNPEFGSGFGSGVAENIAGKGLAAIGGLQKGIEFGMGTTVSLMDMAPGELFASQNQGRGFTEILEEVKEKRRASGRPDNFMDFAGQAQDLAEAFRVTDMPSFKLDLVAGEGINLPGDNTLNEFQFGVKGALELVPDLALTVATGGVSLLATGTKLGLAKGVGTIAARTVGADVLYSGVRRVPLIVRKSADIKKIAAPVYREVANINLQTGVRAISRAKVPEMRQMLNRMSTYAPSLVSGPLSGVMHAANPVMLLDNGKNLMVDLVYGRINALSLIPGGVEGNIAVLAERHGGIRNLPQQIDQALGVDIGRRVAESRVGSAVGRLRDKTLDVLNKDPVDHTPHFLYDKNGLIVSDIADLNGAVWTNKVSAAFNIGEDAWGQTTFTIRKGKGGAIKSGKQKGYLGATDDVDPYEINKFKAYDINGQVIEDVAEGTGTATQAFRKYGVPDEFGNILETDATRFYTSARHMIDTYENMRRHYEMATGNVILKTLKMTHEDGAYVPQIPNLDGRKGDWFDQVRQTLEGSAPVGSKKRPMQERSIFGDDLQAAIENGHYSMAGPMEAMQSFMTSMYGATIDAELAKQVKVLAATEGSGVIDMGAMKRHVNTAITLNKKSRVIKSGKRKGELAVSSEKNIQKIKDNGFALVANHLQEIASNADPEVRKTLLKRLDASFKNDVNELQKGLYAIDTTKGRKAPAFAGIMFKDVDLLDKVTGKPVLDKAGNTVKVEGKKVRDAASKASDLDDKNKAAGLAETAAELGDLLRVGKTGFDFGFHMIHGIPALGFATGRALAGHPVESAKLFKAWAGSTKNTFDAFFRPSVLMETFMKDPQMVLEAVENGLQLSREAQDFFLATQNATILRKIPKAGETMDNVLSDLAKSFERAFVAPGDLLRIEGYRILRNTAGQSENGLTELSGFLNKMTGALSSSASGVSKSQQQLERGFLFFSPRYTRSAMALLLDVYRGGTKGELARQTMVGMALFGGATYYGLAKAMGQEPKLDPSQSDFMSVQMGDATVGIGGFYTQFLKLSSRLAETAWDDNAQEAFGDPKDNPLLRWVRSRVAPGAGVAWDIANGEDFMGRQFSTVGDKITHVGKAALPIWLEAALLEDPYRTGPAGLTAEIFGAGTTDLSAGKRRRQLRDSIAVNAYGKEWDDLNNQQRKSINENADSAKMTANEVTELEDLSAEYLSGRAEIGDDTDVNIERYYARRKEIDTVWTAQVREGIRHLETEGAEVDPQLFRQLYLNGANADKRTRMEDLYDKDGEYSLAMTHFSDVSDKFGNEHPEDVAYAEYIDKIVATEDFDTPRGFSFKERDNRVLAFRQKWGDEVYAYVQETFGVGRNLEPIVEEFYKGRAKFEYYWRGVEELTLAKMPRAGQVKEAYELYLNSDENGKRELKSSDRMLSKYLNLMTKVKQELRQKDQVLDQWLFRWGYTNTLSHVGNKTAPDRISNPREYWRQPEAFPLYTFGLTKGVNLPATEQSTAGSWEDGLM